MTRQPRIQPVVGRKKCDRCGQHYEAKQKYQLYCSARCRTIAWAKRQAVILVILGTLVVAGCTSAVTLRHRDGRMVTCGPYYSYGLPTLIAADRESRCITDYQRQGFERAPE